MPEYLSPGVYIEEIPGPQPIQGVSTSTTGMVGVTLKGPTVGKPELVTSFAEFNQKFGGFIDQPKNDAERLRWELNDREGGFWWRFPLAVKGFFDNGGQRLYVKRVVSSLATESEAAIPSNVIEAWPVGPGEDPLRLAPAPQPPAPALPDLLRAVAKAEGKWGDDISVRVRPVRARRLQVVLAGGPGTLPGPRATTLTRELARNQTTAEVAWPTRLGTLTGPVVVEIARERFQVDTVPGPAGTPPTLTLQLPGTGPSARRLQGTPVKVFQVAELGTGPTRDLLLSSSGEDAIYQNALVLVGPGQARATVTAVATVPQPGDNPPLTRVTLTPLTLASFPRVFESDLVEVIEAVVDVRYEEGASDPDVDRDEPEIIEETFPGLRLDKLSGTTRSIVDFVNAESSLVRFEEVPPAPNAPPVNVGWALFPGRPTTDNRGWIPLTGGDDQLPTLQPTDFAGADGGPGRRTGIQALEDIEDISICAVPGMWSRTVQSAIIGHCERLKDRFAVLDAQRGLTVQGVLAFRSPLDSKYAALYHPWLKVVDPLTTKEVVVPPSGHMTGVYAFVDNDRGVHKAPANVVIQQIVGFDDDINTREQDQLNPVGINALREFPFRGLRVWGARTLSSTPEWRYLNVRRLFIFIEKSIKQGTQWVVFEPNAEPLWALVTQAVTNFLDTVWRAGALEGVKQEEAFFVRCDRTTMTEDDIANGRLIVQIGIAPVRPAEFVIFRFRQKTREQVAAVA
jgi:uncharacterized protein